MICASGLDRERSRTGASGHIVHFILDAVEQLPITDFRVKRLFILKNLAVAA